MGKFLKKYACIFAEEIALCMLLKTYAKNRVY